MEQQEEIVSEVIQVKGKFTKIIFWSLSIFWMGFIFFMSAQTGDESASMSSPVADLVIKIFVPDYEDKTPVEQEDIKHTVELIIRKGAHFTEYAVLGFLVYLVVQMYVLKAKARFMIAWLLSTLYAASDEFHQSFVGGRGPQVKDVCIDSAGAFVGVLLSVVFLLILIRRANNKKQIKHNDKDESKF